MIYHLLNFVDYLLTNGQLQTHIPCIHSQANFKPPYTTTLKLANGCKKSLLPFSKLIHLQWLAKNPKFKVQADTQGGSVLDLDLSKIDLQGYDMDGDECILKDLDYDANIEGDSKGIDEEEGETNENNEGDGA